MNQSAADEQQVNGLLEMLQSVNARLGEQDEGVVDQKEKKRKVFLEKLKKMSDNLFRYLVIYILVIFMGYCISGCNFSKNPKIDKEFLLKWNSRLGMMEPSDSHALKQANTKLDYQENGWRGTRCQSVKLISYDPVALNYTIEVLAPIAVFPTEDPELPVAELERGVPKYEAPLAPRDQIKVIKHQIDRNLFEPSFYTYIRIDSHYKEVLCPDQKIRNEVLMKIVDDRKRFTYRLQQEFPNNALVRAGVSFFGEYPYFVVVFVTLLLDYLVR